MIKYKGQASETVVYYFDLDLSSSNSPYYRILSDYKLYKLFLVLVVLVTFDH